MGQARQLSTLLQFERVPLLLILYLYLVAAAASSNDTCQDIKGAEAANVDFSGMNGKWTQDRHTNLDNYLAHSKVPWFVRRLIRGTTPRMELDLSPDAFVIHFHGKKKKNIDEGVWGVEFVSKDPYACKKVFTYEYDSSLGLVVLETIEVEKKGKPSDISKVTRYLLNGELVMKMGPKLSKKDGKTMVEADRIFKRDT